MVIIYDIECFVNFFSVVLKRGDTIYKYVLFNGVELEMSKSELIDLIKGQTLVGFNNTSYDNIILDYFIENDVVNADLKIVNDSIIATDKPYQVRRKFCSEKSIYESIDLFARNPLGKSSLKVYEHYKRLKNISETPISFDSKVHTEDVELIIQYNIDDVLATEMMYCEVRPLIESLADLGEQYNIGADLRSITGGQIVDKFFKSTVKPNTVPEKIIVDLKQNIDFTIKNEMVAGTLQKLQNCPILEYNYHDLKIDKTINISDVINDKCEASFEADIVNAKIKFGVGGLHSTVKPLNLKSDDEMVIIDCDVNGMYPNVIVKQGIYPFYFTDDQGSDFIRIYSEVIEKRNELKKQGSTLEESYKLILNTLTGKFKEVFSILFDPSCHIKTCIYGQYFLFSVLEKLEPYINLICQVNTDGFTLWVKRSDVQTIENIIASTSGIKWKTKQFNKFVSKDCNNYLALTDKNEVKTKGGVFNLSTFANPQIIKQALIDNLLFDKSVEDVINNNNDLYDYLFFAKPSKKNITVDDEPFNGNVVRFYKSINHGVTIKSNGKQLSNATNVVVANVINDEDIHNVDRQFYINEVNKWITDIKGNQHDEVVNIFAEYGITLCGKTPVAPKDGIILFKGNANKGSELYNYETVGIDMIEHPNLLYIDIDHIDDNHRIMIDLCKKSGTIYSCSDLNTDSYRFFFLNNTDIEGHYVWLNNIGETSLEIWNKVKNKVSISGVKQKNMNGDILERYVVVGDTLKHLTTDIYDWVKSNNPDKVMGIAKKSSPKKTNIPEYDQSDNMTKLYTLMNDSTTKLTTKRGYGKVINLKKKPSWFVDSGEWRDTTVSIFADLTKTNFDVYISSFKNSFKGEEIARLKASLQPFIDQINNDNRDEKPIIVSNIDNEITEEVDEIDDEDEGILKNSPTIPQIVYQNLPTFLRVICDKFENAREKDIFLISSIVTLSSVLNVNGIYWRQTIYPNLYSFIMANAGSGKSAIKYAFDLLTQHRINMKNDYKREVLAHANSGAKTDPPREKVLKIAGNASCAVVLEKLERNNNNGLIFETEADSIVESFKKDWGNYDETLRKAFQHEHIQVDRQTYTINIEQPRLSCLVSGTPRQMLNLIKSTENGLFSRFMYYTYEAVNGFQNPFDIGEDLSKFYNSKSGEVSDIISYYYQAPRQFKLTSEQSIKFTNFFDDIMKTLKITYDDDIDGVVKRLGTQAFKILLIFTAVRKFETSDKTDFVTDVDLDNVLEIMKCLTEHMQIVYNNLSTKDNVVIKSNPKEKLVEFILSQKDKFRRDFVLTKAKNLNISNTTCIRLIKKLIESGKLVKDGKLFYQVNKTNK